MFSSCVSSSSSSRWWLGPLNCCDGSSVVRDNEIKANPPQSTPPQSPTASGPALRHYPLPPPVPLPQPSIPVVHVEQHTHNPQKGSCSSGCCSHKSTEVLSATPTPLIQTSDDVCAPCGHQTGHNLFGTVLRPHIHSACCEHSHSESRKTVQNLKQMVIQIFNMFAPRAHDQDTLYHIGSRCFYKTCRFIPKCVPKFSNGTVRRACIGVSLTCSVAGVICLSSLGFGVPVVVLGGVALVATLGWTGTRSGVNHDDYNIQSKIHILKAQACDVRNNQKEATVSYIHGFFQSKSECNIHKSILTRWFVENVGAISTHVIAVISTVLTAISPIFPGVFGCGVRLITVINSMVRNRGQSHSIRDDLFRKLHDSLENNDGTIDNIHNAINNTKIESVSKKRKQNFTEMKDGIFRVGPYTETGCQNKTSYSPLNAAEGHPSVDKLAYFVLVTGLIRRNITDEDTINKVVNQVFEKAKPIPKFGLKRLFGYYNDELQFDSKRISANQFIDEVLKIIDNEKSSRKENSQPSFNPNHSLRPAQKKALDSAIGLSENSLDLNPNDFDTAFKILKIINDFNEDTKADIVFDAFLLGNHSEKYLAGETILHPHHQGIVWDRIHVYKNGPTFNLKTAATVVANSVGYAVTGIAASVGLLMMPVGIVCYGITLGMPLWIADKITGTRYNHKVGCFLMDYYLKGLSGLSKTMDGFAKPVNEQLSKLSDPDALIPLVDHELAMAKFLELAKKCHDNQDLDIVREFNEYKKDYRGSQERFAHETHHHHGDYALCPHERREPPLGFKIVDGFFKSQEARAVGVQLQAT